MRSCRRVLALLFAILCVASSNAVPLISVGSLSTGLSGVFDLSVNVSDAQDLFAYQVDIVFDPAALTAVSIVEGPFLGTAGTTFFIPGTIDITAGLISLTSSSLLGPGPGATGDGMLFQLRFQPRKIGESDVLIDTAVLLDSTLADIPYIATPGTVGVTGIPEPGTASMLLMGGLFAAWTRRRAWRGKGLLAFASVALIGVAPASAQDSRHPPAIPRAFAAVGHVGASPFDPPTATDTHFVVDQAPGLDTGCTFRSGGPLRFSVKIDRVVGQVNADGTLADPVTLVNNKVVSKFVTLRMPAFDVDFDAVLAPPDQPERDRVLVNGKDIGPAGSVAFLTGANNVWKLNEYSIPVELIRFGKRNVGSAPTAGDNRIEILIDQANIPIGRENWCTAIDWAEMSFEALAPVIMIHGNNSNGAFWTDFDFVKPFKDQKIPYDNSITMVTDTIAVHGTLLATLVPDLAKEFGARHAHIVAHSKGGLDSRDFLARTIPANFGVYSLHTLATPHNGSVGADYSMDSVTANALFSDNTTRTTLARQKPPDLGTPNLRVSFMGGFNTVNLPLLPANLTVDDVTAPVAYRSFSDDANLNSSTSIFGNPTIQHNETQGTGQPASGLLSNNTVWATALEAVYRLMGEVTSTTLAPRTILGRTVFVVRESPTTSFQLNDFLVTVNSARVAGFREVASTKNNHATIANPNVGILTINSIRIIQPVR